MAVFASSYRTSPSVEAVAKKPTKFQKPAADEIAYIN